MAYATKYKIEFDDPTSTTVQIDLQQDGFVGSSTSLICGSAKLVWGEQDRAKDFGIKQSRLEFKVLCDGSFDIEDFLITDDLDYKVIVRISGQNNWYGWLDTKTLEAPFQDSGFYIDLVARDGLHLLEAAKKTDLSDNVIWAAKRVKDIFAYVLDKTELGLNYNTWINIYPDGLSVRTVGNPEQDPFYYSFIDYKTFEGDNAFDLLNKVITSFGCQLFQARGEWQIVYLEDWIRNNGLNCTRWDSSGTALGIYTGQTFDFAVGLNETRKFINADAVQSFANANKSVQLNFAYEVPNLLRNQDLSEGDFDSFLSPANQIIYDLDHWSYTGAKPYILADLDITSDDATEKSRRIHIRTAGSSISANTNVTTLYSTSINCQEGDGFSFSCRVGKEATDSGISLVIKLTRTSPATVLYLGGDGKWKTAIQFLGINASVNTINTPLDVSIATQEPLPSLSSYIEIYFYINAKASSIPSNTPLIGIMDLNFTYNALAALPNKTARGQYNKVERTGTFREKIEDATFISDARNRIFKGVLIDSNSTVLRYWKHTGITESVRFSTLITNALFKLKRRVFNILEGNILYNKAENSTKFISPLNTLKFDYFGDAEFIISTLEVDLTANKFYGTFVELHDGTGDDFTATGTESFRLIDKSLNGVEIPPEEIKKPYDYNYGALGWLVQKIFKKKK